MYSIRRFLLITLLFAITIVMFLAIAWTYFDAVNEAEILLEQQHPTMTEYTLHNARTFALKQIIPLLLLYPLLGIFIWIIVGRALRPIHHISSEIKTREHGSLRPVSLENIPQEITLLVEELNLLFTRLERVFNAQKRFTADASHELRTPLAALKTQTQVALRAVTDAEKDNAFKNIIIGVDRCTHIIEQLSVLANVREDEPLQNPQSIDLNVIAREIISDLINAAIDRQTEIEFYPYEKSAPFIIGNVTLIRILIRNLIDNAIRYTPEHSLIKISVNMAAQKVIFCVEDNGPGVPDELKERIFERFYRQLGTKVSGSGLGLSIVSQIAQLHQADIQIKDASPHGLVILIRFKLPFS